MVLTNDDDADFTTIAKIKLTTKFLIFLKLC